jgi:hypothetical protein
MGIKRYLSLFPYGDPCMEMGIDASPFPYRDCLVTNPFPYGVCEDLGIEDKIPK